MTRNKLTDRLQPYRIITAQYLSSRGLNNNEIGMIMNITREAVRKLLLKRRSSVGKKREIIRIMEL